MMGQIEVLYDLGEPYVRLEDYRAVQARAAALAAEVERLKDDVRLALLDAGQLDYELARLGIDYDGDNPLGRLVEELAALRAQLDAGEWWRPVDEPPSPGKVIRWRTVPYWGSVRQSKWHVPLWGHVDGIDMLCGVTRPEFPTAEKEIEVDVVSIKEQEPTCLRCRALLYGKENNGHAGR